MAKVGAMARIRSEEIAMARAQCLCNYDDVMLIFLFLCITNLF